MPGALKPNRCAVKESIFYTLGTLFVTVPYQQFDIMPVPGQSRGKFMYTGVYGEGINDDDFHDVLD